MVSTDKTDKRARIGASVSNVSASVPPMYEHEQPNGGKNTTRTISADGPVRANALCSVFPQAYGMISVSVKSGTNNMHFQSFFFFLLLHSLLEGTDTLTLLTKGPRPGLVSVLCRSGVCGPGILRGDRRDCRARNECARGAGEGGRTTAACHTPATGEPGIQDGQPDRNNASWANWAAHEADRTNREATGGMRREE